MDKIWFIWDLCKLKICVNDRCRDRLEWPNLMMLPAFTDPDKKRYSWATHPKISSLRTNSFPWQPWHSNILVVKSPQISKYWLWMLVSLLIHLIPMIVSSPMINTLVFFDLRWPGSQSPALRNSKSRWIWKMGWMGSGMMMNDEDGAALNISLWHFSPSWIGKSTINMGDFQ